MVDSDKERPAKRQRVEERADERELSTQKATARYVLQPAHSYSQQAPQFSQPFHFTSFSYDGERRLLLESSGFHDKTLRFYKPPPIPCDLNSNFKEAVYRDPSVLEGLDSLLESLMDLPTNPQTDELLAKTKLITWRGMLTRLMTALYENGRDGWQMNAQMVDGTLYLEDYLSPQALAKKNAGDESNKIQSYYGNSTVSYSFEGFCTSEDRPGNSSSANSAVPTVSVNTNEQWCSVVKINLGGLRIILGGEVDCVQDRPDFEPENIKTSDFIELKTNLVINSPQDEQKFEKFKMLKFYMQSFLIGCPKVIVGFRTREGMLQTLQHFKTTDLPRLVRNKPHAWNPSQALNAGSDLLRFIANTVKTAADTQHFEELLQTSDSVDECKEWPVFRVTFNPGRPSSLEVSQISNFTSSDSSRIGILPRKWLDSVKARIERSL